MASTAFLVRFRFRAPVALGPLGLLPALDALLAAQVAARLLPATGRPPAPIPVPLDDILPGLPAATLIFPVAAAPAPIALQFPRRYQDPVWHGRPLDAVTDVSVSQLRNESSGPFVTHPRPVTAVTVAEAVAYGRGDAVAAAALLRGVTHLGGHRGIGFGLLREPPVVQRVGTAPLLRGPQGGPLLRIVPLRLAPALGLDPDDPRLRAVVQPASVRPPLWFRPWWEPCLVPLPLTSRSHAESLSATLGGAS
jgi:hypothetical protein